MELSAVVEQEEVILTEPESEEADETFYMNRLLMVGTEGTLPASPHINPGSSYDNVISPQIEVLPKRDQKRLLENQLVDESLLIHSARGDAVNKDGDNSTNVDHMTDTAAPRIKNQKRQRTKNVRIGQNTSPLTRLLRSSCRPYPQKSEGNQQRGKSKTKVTKQTSKKRQNSKDASSKKSVSRWSVVVPHSSRGGQQSPGDKLFSSQAINKPKTGKVLNMKSIHKRNRFGETWLHTSARNGDVQSVEDMIQFGACVNVADNAGWTPLHEAVLHGHYTIVKTLLKAGAQVNLAGYNGITPLQDAVLLCNLEVTELLLRHNADPLLKNNKGEAAIDINKDLNVQNLLRKYMSMTQTTCSSDQRVPIAESCVESGIEDSGRRHCREARHSAEKDEATTNQQSTKTEASVSPDAGDEENIHDPFIDGEGSSKVSSELTVPLQRRQAKNVTIADSFLAHDGSFHIQDPEHLIPDTSSMASDSESDVTVDYIETHSSSPGHWFLSATQDFSGSIHRLVGEIARRDANSLDAGPLRSQSLVSAANKSKQIRSKGSKKNIADNASKRSLDGSRDDRETVSRKKIRRISVTNRNEAFLDYLLNFDLNSVCVANSGSGNESVAKKGSDGSASYAYASPKHNNVCKNHLTASAICQKDTCASQIQIDSPVECSVSLLAPCQNDVSASNLEEQPMVGEPLRAVMLSPLPSTGTSLESADCGSPSLLIDTYRVHDQGLTCSPEPHVRLNVLEQSEVTDESLKTLRNIQDSSKSVTSSPQMCVDGGNRKQKALPLLNLSSGSITKDDACELCQTNIDFVNNLPSNEMLSSSEETITPSLHLLSYGNLLHSRNDKLDTPTKQVQQRKDNRDSVNSELSCTQAPASPSKTCSIVSTEIQDGGQSGLSLVETTSETEKRNTMTPDVNVPEPSLLLTLPCAKDDCTDVETDDSTVSADSDCTVVEEPEPKKTTDKDVEDVAVCQLNQNDIPVAIICDEEQYIVEHGLHRAPDERGTGEQRKNPTDPLDTGTSVSILRDLAQRQLCLLPTPDNNQESSDRVKEHNLQIAVENEEVSFTDMLISQRQKKTGISTTDVRKKSSKFKLDKHSNSVDAGWTPLHKAKSAAGHVDVLEQHLHAGADVKRPRPDGVTPPHSSVFCRHYEHDTNPHDKQGSGCLPHEHKLQDNHICKTPPSAFCSVENTSAHKKDSSGSSVLCEERFLPLTLQEVEEKQNEMSAWSLNEPEDRETQTVLKNVFSKQHVEKIHRSKESRTTSDSIHDGQLSQTLLDFASRQKYLLMLLQKQNKLMKHKLKMSTDQHCSSSNTSTEISALNDLQHSLPFTDQDEKISNVCQHKYSTSNHSHLESQSVTSDIACPSLLSGKPATSDDSRISRGLNRKGVIQPGDNTLEVPLMGSSQESSLKHTRGKTFSAAEHKVTTHGSKTPRDCSLTADLSSGNGPQQQQVQQNAPGLTCTRSSEEAGSSAKETIRSIRSIRLIRDEEFLPCYLMDRYWNSFIQSEDWGF